MSLSFFIFFAYLSSVYIEFVNLRTIFHKSYSRSILDWNSNNSRINNIFDDITIYRSLISLWIGQFLFKCTFERPVYAFMECEHSQNAISFESGRLKIQNDNLWSVMSKKVLVSKCQILYRRKNVMSTIIISLSRILLEIESTQIMWDHNL